MHTKHASVNNCGEREIVKDIRTISPHSRRSIFPGTFIIKPIDLGDLSALMVAAYETDAIRPADLEREKEQERLDAKVSAVDKIAHEEVAPLGALACGLEQLEQIPELAVDVAADGHGGVDALDVALFNKDFPGFYT